MLLHKLFREAKTHVQSLCQFTMSLQIEMDGIAISLVGARCREVFPFNIDLVVNILVKKNVVVNCNLSHQVHHVDVFLLPVMDLGQAEVLSVQLIELECLVHFQLP